MDSIIVGTDGSDGAQAAVAEAGRLASAYGRRVVLVSAYPGATVTAAAMMPHAPVLPTDDARIDAEKVLSDAAERLRAQGIACDTRAVCGSAAEALIDVAALEQAATIVVGSRGMRGAGRIL